jgi:hypothetical protein
MMEGGPGLVNVRFSLLGGRKTFISADQRAPVGPARGPDSHLDGKMVRGQAIPLGAVERDLLLDDARGEGLGLLAAVETVEDEAVVRH